MKNPTYFSLFFLLTILAACSNPEGNYPEKLKSIPNGINVSHSKEKVYAELNNEDPDIYGKYVWKFETTVSTEEKDIEIIEFGAYLWENGAWVSRTIYDRPFNSGEFSDWYSCPNAILKSGKEYSDPKNWSKGSNLDGKETKALWYFIGQGENGDKIKGTAVIVTVGKME